MSACVHFSLSNSKGENTLNIAIVFHGYAEECSDYYSGSWSLNFELLKDLQRLAVSDVERTIED